MSLSSIKLSYRVLTRDGRKRKTLLAGMVEQEDTTDLKSVARIGRASSSLALGIRILELDDNGSTVSSAHRICTKT